MDVIEAIETRRSIRAFLERPVPKQVLEDIMRVTLRSPSSSNSQPWEFAVVGGRILNSVRVALALKAASGTPPQSDFPWPTIEGRYRERIRRHGKRFYQHLGIARGDKAATRDWERSMVRFFDAPNGIIVYIDGSFSDWALLDIGMVLAHLVLAAWHHGVGTCVVGPVAYYPDVLRELLGIPQSKRIVVGLAVGYPDMCSPLVRFESGRESLDTLVTWHGYDLPDTCKSSGPKTGIERTAE